MIRHAPEGYQCPFCLLIQGIKNEHVLSVHSDIITYTDQVTALISSHQWPKNPGNTIIVPNEHFENIYDLPLHYAASIQEMAQQIALAMKAVFSCDGISTRQHNEPAGSQDVWHYHLHVTPRYQHDDFYRSRYVFMPVEERAVYADRLRAYLDKK
jgi:histidine triad (HIT) family protein